VPPPPPPLHELEAVLLAELERERERELAPPRVSDPATVTADADTVIADADTVTADATTATASQGEDDDDDDDDDGTAPPPPPPLWQWRELAFPELAERPPSFLCAWHQLSAADRAIAMPAMRDDAAARCRALLAPPAADPAPVPAHCLRLDALLACAAAAGPGSGRSWAMRQAASPCPAPRLPSLKPKRKRRKNGRISYATASSKTFKSSLGTVLEHFAEDECEFIECDGLCDACLRLSPAAAATAFARGRARSCGRDGDDSNGHGRSRLARAAEQLSRTLHGLVVAVRV
jgi:hypothetical protein